MKLNVKEYYVIQPPSYHWLGFSRLRDSRIFLLAFQDILDKVALPLPTFKNDAMCLNSSRKGIIDKLIPLKLSYSGYYCSMTVGSRFQCKVTRIEVVHDQGLNYECASWALSPQIQTAYDAYVILRVDRPYIVVKHLDIFRWNSNASNLMLNRYFYDKGCV